MLGTLDIEFDHADFLRKLRHYFMDSAPVDVDLVIKANSVLIKGLRSGKEVEYYLNSERSVKDNIHDLAVLCEKSIYPVLEKEIIIKKNLSLEERKKTNYDHPSSLENDLNINSVAFSCLFIY